MYIEGYARVIHSRVIKGYVDEVIQLFIKVIMNIYIYRERESEREVIG